MILDIHTHHPAPQPQAVIDASPRIGAAAIGLADSQLYSAGIHPWDTVQEIPDSMWSELERLLNLPQFVAVGECGVDLSGRGGMMFRQLQVFKRQIDLSERLGKPMVVHCVKAEDVICGLRRDLRPQQPWIIHGFRKKPATAEQLLKSGCLISFGAMFNEETLRLIPSDRLLAETDDSDKTIEEVISALSAVRDEDLTDIISTNISKLINYTYSK